MSNPIASNQTRQHFLCRSGRQYPVPDGMEWQPIHESHTGAVDALTICTARGEAVGKVIDYEDGQWTKTTLQEKGLYLARQVPVRTAEDLREILAGLNSSQALVMGALKGGWLFHQGFQFLSIYKLRQLLGLGDLVNGDAPLGAFKWQGTWYLARIKENLAPCTWRLFDIDPHPNMPRHWRDDWKQDDWISAIDGAVPRMRLRDAEKVVCRSSSARVILADGSPAVGDGGGFHFYAQIPEGSDADLSWIGWLKLRLIGKHYHYSKSNLRGGSSLQTLFDSVAMLSSNRLSYEGPPSIGPQAQRMGARYGDRDLRVEGVPGARLLVDSIQPPTSEERTACLEAAEACVGRGRAEINRSGSVSVVDLEGLGLDYLFETQNYGSLNWIGLLEILRTGVDKIRLQANWRDSTSWNALARQAESGMSFVFDNGEYLLRWPSPEAQGQIWTWLEGLGDADIRPSPAPEPEWAEVEERALAARAARDEEVAGLQSTLAAEFGATKDRSAKEWNNSESTKALAKALGMSLTEIRDLRQRYKARDNEYQAALADGARLAEEKEEKRRQDAEERRKSDRVAKEIKTGGLLVQARHEWAKGLLEADPQVLKMKSGKKGSKGPVNGSSNVYQILASGCGYVLPQVRKNLLTGLVEIQDITSTRFEPDLGRYVTEFGDPRGMRMTDYYGFHCEIDHYIGGELSTGFIDKQIEKLAEERAYDPIREYLGRVWWDGTPRLMYWLPQAVGCPDDEVHRQMGMVLLTKAVERVLYPGRKFDQMLILRGSQGLGKSTLVEALARHSDWYADVGIDPTNIDRSAEHMQGRWWVEVGELKGMRKAEMREVKQFISRNEDRYRAPYARQAESRPRRMIMVGTTNEGQFLSDVTGNRRFWPVDCTNIDVKYVKRNVDQLYAEAVCFVRKHGKACEMPPYLYERLDHLQESKRMNDDMEEVVLWALEEVMLLLQEAQGLVDDGRVEDVDQAWNVVGDRLAQDRGQRAFGDQPLTSEPDYLPLAKLSGLSRDRCELIIPSIELRKVVKREILEKTNFDSRFDRSMEFFCARFGTRRLHGKKSRAKKCRIFDVKKINQHLNAD